ncbi:MAG: UDP-N-acetylmuramate--L-alanine ligase [Candidatus Howiella sp.]
MKQRTKTDLLIEQAHKIHMIGIGGSGMCPLAEILHSKGYEITGSDNNESDPLKRVRALGIPVTMGHKAESVKGADLVVYSAAIHDDNPELVAAKALGIPAIERSFLLGAVTRRYDDVIGVCGTHGKTTTTSMITQILVMAAYDPTAVIGGRLPLTGSNGLAGHSSYMVCEACEYVDTFLKLSPDIAVLLNIDNDHLEYFKTMENLTLSFKKFCDMAQKQVIVNGDDDRAMAATADAAGRRITFGMEETNCYHAKNVAAGPVGMEFDAFEDGTFLMHVSLQIPGRHNVYNALAAIAAVRYLGVGTDEIENALASFHGAGRRFELLGEFDGILLADDYAHHPTEIRATLSAAQNMGRAGRVIGIFQPFTFSRTAMLKTDFIDALSHADKVLLTPIMGSREQNTYGIRSEDLAAGLSDALVLETFDQVADYIAREARPGDLVITMGGGDIYKAAYKIRDLLSKSHAG